MPPSIQAQYQASGHIHKPNGLASHDLEVTISAWWRAWTTVKPWLSGIAVVIVAALWHFLNSAWFNAPVPASQLTAVTSEQRGAHPHNAISGSGLGKTRHGPRRNACRCLLHEGCVLKPTPSSLFPTHCPNSTFYETPCTTSSAYRMVS